MAKKLNKLDMKILKMMKHFKLPKKHFKLFKRDVITDYEDETSNENKIAQLVTVRDLVEIYDASYDNY